MASLTFKHVQNKKGLIFAMCSNGPLTPSPLNITEVTTQAFELLGEDAVSNDPTSVIGVDENQNIPPLTKATEVQAQPQSSVSISDHSDNAMNIENTNVTMVVLDGIIMGPTVIFLI
jgi:hypothetical protein